MEEISLLIGGKAGDGINQAGLVLAQLFSQIGYRVYTYFDYPSLIRGGHNFSIIRASKNKVSTHKDKIDFLLALNQDTINFHNKRLKEKSQIIYDSEVVKSEGLGLALTRIVREKNAKPIMRNSCLIGAFAKSVGIEWEILEGVFVENTPYETDLNLKLALEGYQIAEELEKIEPLQREILPIFTGNEAIALGLVNAGLRAYIAYPMTPSSSLLHFLAGASDKFNLKVIHPENEIAVILMALGFSFTGEKTAVGTSGGGFCLMTEGLSLAGMAELPIVIVVAQRPGPSTGVPTYTAQGDLNFVLNAGQGEFIRFVVSPGDAEQAFYWSGIALNISWKYQIPSVILSDKALSEGSFSFDITEAGRIKQEQPLLWDKKQPYKRYLNTDTGISPLVFVPDKEAIVKVNSYEHDEYGITTESHQAIKLMQDKRLKKTKYLAEELTKLQAVGVYGDRSSPVCLLCWGSNKGVCQELADILGIRVVQPVVISPFPEQQFRNSLKGVKKIISVECNATAQLSRLMKVYGFGVDKNILKYDGRPFSLEELQEEVKKVL
jgi:2-oxoglutarate ferredoxin oxidoreductase subunit alpha